MKRRKPVTILAVVMAWLLFASTALAVVTIEGNNVYANGHAITVDDVGGETRVSSSEAGAVTGSVGTTNVNGYNIYGGSNAQGEDGKIIRDGSDDSATVNGTSVTINGGTVGNVYGGGHAEGGDGYLGGDGGDANATVNGSTNVVINGGTVTGDVYGGGNAESGGGGKGGDANTVVTGSANVTINGGTVNGNVYGGGNEADGGAIFHGTSSDTVGSTNVTVADGSSVGQSVYGGGDEGSVTGNTVVNVTDSTVGQSVYGGGDEGTAGSTTVNVAGSDVDQSVYGGSRDNDVSGSATVNVTAGSTVGGSVYGGGGAGGLFQDSSVGGNTSVTVDNSTVTGNVYGGSEDGNVSGTTTVNIQNGAHTGKVYGGSKNGDTGKSNITISDEGTTTGTIFAGADQLGTTAGSTITLNGGTVTGGSVFGWGGNDLLAPVTGQVTINVSQLSARGYTFYLPRALDASGAIVRTGNLQWDGVAKASGIILPSFYYAYQLTQLAARDIGVVTKFMNGGDEVYTVTSSVNVAPGATAMASPASSFPGSENYTIGTLPADEPVNYGTTGPVNFTVEATPKTKPVKVIYNFNLGSALVTDPVFTTSEFKDVTYGAAPYPVSHTWTGTTNVNGGTAGGDISYQAGVDEFTFNTTVTGVTKPVKVIYNFNLGSALVTDPVFTTSEFKDVTYGAAPYSVSYTWTGSTNVNGGTAGGDIAYQVGVDEFTFSTTVTGVTKPVKVIYNFNLGSASVTDPVFTTEEFKDVTYGASPYSVSYTWTGSTNVNGGTAGGEISYQAGVDEFTFSTSVTGITKQVKVTYNFTLGNTVIFTTSEDKDVTYGAAPFSVSYAWGGSRRYTGGTAGGDISYQAGVNEFTFSTGVSRVDDDDDTLQIPLSPGEPGIPLGVPSTGDGVSMNLLLMALGAAVVAFAAVKSKRSSAR